MISRRIVKSISWNSNRLYSSLPISNLQGSAPNYSRHLIIHGPTSKSWPSHFESVSPLFKELLSRWGNHEEPKLKRLGYTFSESDILEDRGWDRMKGKLDIPDVQVEEVYSAILYPDFIPITLSLSKLEGFESYYLSLAPTPIVKSTMAPENLSSSNTTSVKNVDIFVCTHARRDCRCGDIGEPLVKAIKREVSKRRLGKEWNITVNRISHIGGHKFSGNALVYKEGGHSEWYGLLRDIDASKLVESALSDSAEPLYDHWRGRLGLSSEEVKSMYEFRVIPLDLVGKKKKQRALVQLGDPVELKFRSYEGELFVVTAFENESIMDAAVRAELPSIEALCGGHAECATCHCLIPKADEANFPQISEEEEEQLDFALGRTEDSRLSCQLPVTKTLGEWVKNGGIIDLPRY